MQFKPEFPRQVMNFPRIFAVRYSLVEIIPYSQIFAFSRHPAKSQEIVRIKHFPNEERKSVENFSVIMNGWKGRLVHNFLLIVLQTHLELSPNSPSTPSVPILVNT